MKLSDIKGVDAVNTAADLMDPIARIATSGKIKGISAEFAKEMAKPLSAQEVMMAKITYAKNLLKACPTEIIEIFAILDGVPVEEYEFTLALFPKKIVELINDPYVMELFGLQSQNKTSSGSATESIEVVEK